MGMGMGMGMGVGAVETLGLTNTVMEKVEGCRVVKDVSGVGVTE
jgi:hypothetical protein